MAVAPLAIAWSGGADTQYWELVPLLALPELDLSVSVKSRIVPNRHVARLISAVARSPLTFVTYMIAIGLTTAVFYVPAPVGRVLGVTALVLGIPGALIAIFNLRYDMVAVMIRTLDVWFAAVVATICFVSLGLIFHDARAALLLPFWLGFLTNACVDANVLALQSVRIANVAAVLTYFAVAIAVSLDLIDDLTAVPLVSVNGYTLSAIIVVRECLVTMIIVVGRNVLRKHLPARDGQQHVTNMTRFRCVSFRCRLRQQAAVDQRTTQRISRQTFTDTSGNRSKAKLHYIPALPVLDAHHSIVPMPWLWRHCVNDLARLRLLLRYISLFGVLVPSALLLVRLVSAHVLDRRGDILIAIVGVCASTVFVGLTTATAQRDLFWAIVTSFDFLYIAFKITTAHVTIASLLGWQPSVVLSLVACWFWWLWLLWWDAILPSARKRLGLSRRMVSGVALALVSVLAFVVVAVVLRDPSTAIGDPVLIRVRLYDRLLEVRAFSWLLSSVASVTPWILRIVWRLWLATDTELIVLDGTVVFENQKPSKRTAPNAAPRVHSLPSNRPHGMTLRST